MFNLIVKSKTVDSLEIVSLGQSGFRFRSGDTTIYIDPYLSDSVEKLEGRRSRRQIPVWKSPTLIHDADWVLITHLHLDHCDLETLRPISNASPMCRFVGPREVCRYLERNGIASNRLLTVPMNWMELASGVRIHAVPAAHPAIETDSDGHWRCVGYIIAIDGRRFYHAGDTSLTTELLEFLMRFRPIDTVFLPVNERNYFRDRLGIIANMGLRDAFGLADSIGAKKLVPMHWDMFLPNSVFREEIELHYRLSKPSFELIINPGVL